MAHFIKPKRSAAPTPGICDHCRTRPGEVHIRSLGGIGGARGGSEHSADWWLCAVCAATLRSDEPRDS
jgi:hypothetical protein